MMVILEALSIFVVFLAFKIGSIIFSKHWFVWMCGTSKSHGLENHHSRWKWPYRMFGSTRMRISPASGRGQKRRIHPKIPCHIHKKIMTLLKIGFCGDLFQTNACGKPLFWTNKSLDWKGKFWEPWSSLGHTKTLCPCGSGPGCVLSFLGFLLEEQGFVNRP